MPPTPSSTGASLLFLTSLPSTTHLSFAISKALSTHPKTLDIAVPLPFCTSRRRTFYATEKIVNTLYALTKDTDTDVRVLLTTTNEADCGGVVLLDSSLKSLASRWSAITIAGSHKGWDGIHVTVIPSHLDTGDHSVWWEASQDVDTAEGKEHTYTCVGGTFDYPIHAGHKLLLTMTFYLLSSGTFIVGLTGSELLKNKTHGEYLTSWSQRCDGVIAFLRAIALDDRSITKSVQEETSDLPTTNRLKKYPIGEDVTVEVHEIQDAYGPTIAVEAVSTLTVSEETKSGGESVNVKRQEKGWSDLEVFVVGLVGGDGQGKLSSTEMRRRKMEKGGKI